MCTAASRLLADTIPRGNDTPGNKRYPQKVSHPHGNGRGRFFTSFSPVHHAYGHLPRLKLKWNDARMHTRSNERMHAHTDGADF